MGRALLHFVPAAMLGIALWHLPYGYYMLLRVVVMVAALLSANIAYRRERALSPWAVLFLIVGAVFNPFVPLRLTRGVWSVLNVAAALLFLANFHFHKSVRK